MLATTLKRLFLAHSTIEAQLYPALELPVRFRSFTNADYEPCVSIYRQNEPDRFPPSDGKSFEACLRNNSRSFIVAELDSRVIGYGGIHVLSSETAVLFYGMVARAYQRKRVGATLTLLRLAQLPPQACGYFAFIFAVEASMNIYQQLGFIRMPEGWPDDDKKLHPIGLLQVSPPTLTKIKSTLMRRGVRLEGELSLQPSSGMFCKVDRTPGRLCFEFAKRATGTPSETA